MRERRDISYRSLIVGSPPEGDDSVEEDEPSSNTAPNSRLRCANNGTADQPVTRYHPAEQRAVIVFGVETRRQKTNENAKKNASSTRVANGVREPSPVPVRAKVHVFRSLSATVLFRERIDEDRCWTTQEHAVHTSSAALEMSGGCSPTVVRYRSGAVASDPESCDSCPAVLPALPRRVNSKSSTTSGSPSQRRGLKKDNESSNSLASIAMSIGEAAHKNNESASGNKNNKDEGGAALERTTSEIFEYWSPLLLNFGPAPAAMRKNNASSPVVQCPNVESKQAAVVSSLEDGVKRGKLKKVPSARLSLQNSLKVCTKINFQRNGLILLLLVTSMHH